MGRISDALKQIREAYYARTARNLQDFVLSTEVFEALQQELYCELELDELPNGIVLYGMKIRKES